MLGWYFEVYIVLILITRHKINYIVKSQGQVIAGNNVCGDRRISKNLISNFLEYTPRHLQQLHQLKLSNIPSPTPTSHLVL